MFFEGKLSTDRNFIRHWIEMQHGWPAVKRLLNGNTEVRTLQVGFENEGTVEDLTPISWDEFFEEFEKKRLVFLYQDQARQDTHHLPYQFL